MRGMVLVKRALLRLCALDLLDLASSGWSFVIAVLRLLLFFGFRMYSRVWVIEFCRTLVISPGAREMHSLQVKLYMNISISMYARQFAQQRPSPSDF